MIRATRILLASEIPAGETDHIELDFDHRHRRRIAMTSAGGKTFLLDLRTAAAMRDGDALALDDGSVIIVRAKAEQVVDISAGDPTRLARIAWHLGNRHLATEILNGKLRILNDSVIVDMVRGLGASVEFRSAPFQPEGGAYEQQHEH